MSEEQTTPDDLEATLTAELDAGAQAAAAGATEAGEAEAGAEAAEKVAEPDPKDVKIAELEKQQTEMVRRVSELQSQMMNSMLDDDSEPEPVEDDQVEDLGLSDEQIEALTPSQRIRLTQEISRREARLAAETMEKRLRKDAIGPIQQHLVNQTRAAEAQEVVAKIGAAEFERLRPKAAAVAKELGLNSVKAAFELAQAREQGPAVEKANRDKKVAEARAGSERPAKVATKATAVGGRVTAKDVQQQAFDELSPELQRALQGQE